MMQQSKLVRNFTPSVIPNSISSNDINKMKLRVLDNAINTAIGRLNINLLWNKFSCFEDMMIRKLLDIVLVSESNQN